MKTFISKHPRKQLTNVTGVRRGGLKDLASKGCKEKPVEKAKYTTVRGIQNSTYLKSFCNPNV